MGDSSDSKLATPTGTAPLRLFIPPERSSRTVKTSTPSGMLPLNLLSLGQGSNYRRGSSVGMERLGVWNCIFPRSEFQISELKCGENRSSCA